MNEPQPPGADNPQNPFALTQRGQALLDAKRPADALPVLLQAVALNPVAAHPRCLLALAHLRLDQPREALQAAQDAAACAPEYEWPHRLRASALIQLGHRGEALEAARQAVRLAPERPEVYLMAAEAELAMRNLAAARAAALTALSLDPHRPGAHVMLSTLALRAGAWRQAETHARDALGTDPENTAALNNLGLALRGLGRRREAVHYLGTASRLDPRNPLYRRNAMRATTRFSIGFVLLAVLLAEVLSAGWGAGLLGTGVVALALFLGTAIRAGRVQGWTAGPAAWWQRRRSPSADPQASQELMRALRRERLRTSFNPEKIRKPEALLVVATLVALLAYLGTIGKPPHSLAVAAFLATLGAWVVRTAYLRWRR